MQIRPKWGAIGSRSGFSSNFLCAIRQIILIVCVLVSLFEKKNYDSCEL